MLCQISSLHSTKFCFLKIQNPSRFSHTGGGGGGGGGGYVPSPPISPSTPVTTIPKTACTPKLSSSQITSILNLLKALRADQNIIDKVNVSLTCPASLSPTSSSASPPLKTKGYQFTRNLRLGMKGEDVRQLQIFLNNQGFIVSAAGPGSPGQETEYFGLATGQALVRFQETYTSEILVPAGLTKGSGFFGPSTMKKINKIIKQF